MSNGRPLSSNPPRSSNRTFEQRIKRLARELDLNPAKAARAYNAYLRARGFDKRQAEILADVTPGAALASSAHGAPLASFFETAQRAGKELAKWDLHPNRIASAIRDYTAVVPLNTSPSSSQQVLDDLVFAITCRVNDGYHSMRETETQALFGLLRAIGESTDVYPLLRRFVESVTTYFGAAAGHVFLLDSPGNEWRLTGSTADAVSGQAAASVPATAATKRMLKVPREVDASRHRVVLLDSGWRKRWNHFWSVPMLAREELVGVLQLAFATRCEILPRDLELLFLATEQTLAAAERTQTIQNIASREQKIFELARRMLQVEEIERRRISRQLHDDAGQSLVVIRLQMEMIEQSMPPDAAEWRERLAEARDITETTILHMRRLIAELSPAVLEQLGLAAGLRQLVNRFRQSYPCKVKLHIGKLPKLAGDFQIVVYRLAQECLKNISKHSGAANVNISVSATDRLLRLRVLDDGVGFDVQAGLAKKHCFGLLGMRERVALLGGICQIKTTPQSGDLKARARNSGTDVDIQLPIPANSPSASLQDVVG